MNVADNAKHTILANRLNFSEWLKGEIPPPLTIARRAGIGAVVNIDARIFKHYFTGGGLIDTGINNYTIQAVGGQYKFKAVPTNNLYTIQYKGEHV